MLGGFAACEPLGRLLTLFFPYPLVVCVCVCVCVFALLFSTQELHMGLTGGSPRNQLWGPCPLKLTRVGRKSPHPECFEQENLSLERRILVVATCEDSETLALNAFEGLEN